MKNKPGVQVTALAVINPGITIINKTLHLTFLRPVAKIRKQCLKRCIHGVAA